MKPFPFTTEYCALKEGTATHKVQPYALNNRSGFVCMGCSKTWEWIDGELVGSWDLMKRRGLI